MKPTRSQLIAFLAVTLSLSSQAVAQGGCIRSYGQPQCVTTAIKPVFEKTGWRTVAMDHITWRVADPQAEAGFYAALMGWKLRSNEPDKVVMDMGPWGSAIFKRMPAAAAAPADSGRGAAAGAGAGRGGGRGGGGGGARAVVESYGFAIEPWNARAVEQSLRARGMDPVAENGPGGFESFWVKDAGGWPLQISNGKGLTAQRATAYPAQNLKLPFAATGWQTVWLDHFSFGVPNYKESASYYQQLLGWSPTYDEGTQNEMMMGDVGNTIIRGANMLAPNYQPRAGATTSVGHISFGISPWDADSVAAALEQRGLPVRIDTSDGAEIHVAMFQSYHTRSPNGYDVQISWNTNDTRLNLAIAVNPRRFCVGADPRRPAC